MARVYGGERLVCRRVAAQVRVQRSQQRIRALTTRQVMTFISWDHAAGLVTKIVNRGPPALWLGLKN